VRHQFRLRAKGGAILEHSTQERVKQTIFSEIHNKQYTMAGEAPICDGEWFNKFGYTSNTPASRAVLDGMYVAPQDLEKATQDLFDEITAICHRALKDSVSICSVEAILESCQ
jgi:enamine deaminase RidA (YjgF/YER057c/UK114 family)